MRAALVAVAVVVLVAASCGGGDDSVSVLPFEEVQATEFVFEADPFDPGRGIFRVVTTEPMICAIVWGETEALGNFNNSLAMNGTGIIDHDVVLPGAESGQTYFFRVQGSTADGQLYQSELATFTIPEVDAAAVPDAPSVDVGANLAPGATVVDVSSEFSDAFAGALAIDDDNATEWATSGDGSDGYLVLDLGAPQPLAGVEFVTRSMADGSAVTTTYTVQVDDGEVLGPFDASTLAAPAVQALDVTGQVVRFDVTDSTGGNTGAVEVRVFGLP